jgi:hypothetical protein
MYQCAMVKAQAGYIEEAIDDIEQMLPVYNVHHWDLALNPDWDPLRGHPRFEALAQTPIRERTR